MLESLADGDDSEIWLYYGNLNSRTHAFRHRIREHIARLPRLRVFNHYAAPLETDRLTLDYDSTELITAELVDAELIARRARVYLCGPPAMMHSTCLRGMRQSMWP